MAKDPEDDKDLENNENSDSELEKEASEDGVSSDEIIAESEASAEDSVEDTEPDAEEIDDIEDAEVLSEGLTDDAEAEPVDELEQVASVDETPAPVVQEAKPRSGMGAIFGGLIAGAIGFAAATFGIPQVSSSSGDDLSVQVGTNAEALAEQAALLDELQNQISTTPASGAGEVDLGPITSSVDAVASDLSSIQGRVTELADGFALADSRLVALETSNGEGAGSAVVQSLEDRLAALEASSASLTDQLAALEGSIETLMPDGRAAMAAQLESFQSELDSVTEAARAEIATVQERASEIEAAAAEAEAQAKAAAALANIRAALENGSPFEAALADLSEVPDALSEVAKDGAPTLAELREEFPPLAREALALPQAAPEDAGAGDRLAAFLRRQTNARSLAPQEGDGTDAVLSRVEAAVSEGSLSTALTELQSLPETAQAIFTNWVESAGQRQAAVDAVEALSSTAN